METAVIGYAMKPICKEEDRAREIMNVTLKYKNEKKTEERAKCKRKIEKEEEEKFAKVLDRCKEFLSSAMSNGSDIFELLDPLISDTQCHIHAVLILSILHKCYNYRESTYYGIEKLVEKDKLILSHAVLLSLLKIQFEDQLGFTIHEISIRNFNSLILPSRNREKYYVTKAKEIFNSYSVDHIRNLAGGQIKEVLNECQVTAESSQLKFLPCYASLQAVIDYIKQAKLPIIISLLSINREFSNKGNRYSINNNNSNINDNINNNNSNNKDVRFYEYREEKGRFFYKKELTESDKQLPTITFRCYSLSNIDNAQELPVNSDIESLLMSATAIHVQLPKNTKLPAGDNDGEEYVRKLYEKHVDILNKYNRHCELAKESNLTAARYAKLVKTSVDPETDEIYLTVRRSEEDTYFTVEHVCLSNYAREYQGLNSSGFGSQVDQRDTLKFNVKKMTSEALRDFNTSKNNNLGSR